MEALNVLTQKPTRLFGLLIVFFAVQACQSSADLQTTDLQATATESSVATQTELEAGQSSPAPNDLPASTTLPISERQTAEEFSTTDRPDDIEGYQIHFIYALPRDGEDDLLDVSGEIALSAAAMNYWLEGQTGHRLRYDTFQGELDVSFLQFSQTADEISDLGTSILTFVEHEIKVRGFDSSHKLFVVHYDGFFVTPEGYCGLASYPPDGAGQTAVLLLRGYNPKFDAVCPRQFTKSEDFTGYFEITILHEVLHLLGLVPACAPNNTDGHVSDSSQDLMYYQYDGSYSPIYTFLDYHNNDYYNHGDPNCPDLARSIFLEPLPENAQLPPGWDVSSNYVPPDPFGEK